MNIFEWKRKSAGFNAHIFLFLYVYVYLHVLSAADCLIKHKPFLTGYNFKKAN